MLPAVMNMMSSLRASFLELTWPITALEEASEEESKGGSGAMVAIIVLLILVALGIAAYFFMQRRERMIQAYAEEEARMRSSIPEMQARIDQQVDLEVAAASATGSSFTATLPRASMAALDEPPPPPKMSLPGCGPVLPRSSTGTASGTASTGRASFAASVSRRSVLSHQQSEYALGDDRPSIVAEGEAVKRTSAARKSMADLAESRKSLVEVIKMYGPDEETVEAPTSRTSLSGWYADDKKRGSGDVEDTEKRGSQRGSLSSWYTDGKQSESAGAPPDPSKVVKIDSGKEGTEAKPSTD